MASIRSSALEWLAVEDNTSIPTCAAPKDAPAGAPTAAPTLAPEAARYVPAEYLMCCSAVLEWPRSTVLQIGMIEPPSFAERVTSFRVYAGTPDNRRTGDLWRIWNDEEDAPLDLPSAAHHASAFLNCLQAEHRFAGRLIPASDLKKQYPRFCQAMSLPERPWQSIAAHLSRLTGGQRVYRRINGHNVRVYRIPERRKRTRGRVLGLTPRA